METLAHSYMLYDESVVAIERIRADYKRAQTDRSLSLQNEMTYQRLKREYNTALQTWKVARKIYHGQNQELTNCEIRSFARTQPFGIDCERNQDVFKYKILKERAQYDHKLLVLDGNNLFNGLIDRLGLKEDKKVIQDGEQAAAKMRERCQELATNMQNRIMYEGRDVPPHNLVEAPDQIPYNPFDHHLANNNHP